MILGRRRSSPEDARAQHEDVHHASMILRMFVDKLARRREAQMLDVGSICGTNISFFAERVRRLFICDMYVHLDGLLRKGLPPKGMWRQLDYPPESFDGILLWDLLDRLEDRDVDTLVTLCQQMARPHGVVVIFASAEQADRSIVESLVMEEDFKFCSRRQPHLRLPLYRRENRDLLTLLAPFRPVKTYIHRNGLREFLFRVD